MKFRLFQLVLAIFLALNLGCSGDSPKSKSNNSTSSTTTTTVLNDDSTDTGSTGGSGHGSGGGSGGSEPGDEPTHTLTESNFGPTVFAASSEDYDIIVKMGGSVATLNIQSDSGELSLSGEEF